MEQPIVILWHRAAGKRKNLEKIDDVQQTQESVWQLECQKTSIWCRNSLFGAGKCSEAAFSKAKSPLVAGCGKAISHPSCFSSATRCVNMEGESFAVTADGVKTLTTFPWSRFIQSIHPITGDGLMLPCWNGQCLYLFLYFLYARLSLQA